MNIQTMVFVYLVRVGCILLAQALLNVNDVNVVMNLKEAYVSLVKWDHFLLMDLVVELVQ